MSTTIYVLHEERADKQELVNYYSSLDKAMTAATITASLRTGIDISDIEFYPVGDAFHVVEQYRKIRITSELLF